MPGNGNIDTQINWLENDVKAHKDIEAYPLWIRLVGVLSSMGTEIESIVVALRGDGNGNQGFIQRMTSMEGMQKDMKSDLRELNHLVRIALGMEHDPEALEKIPRFTAEDHPARRAEDNKTLSDKLLGYVVERILPPLVVSLILGAVAFWVAVQNHLLGGV